MSIEAKPGTLFLLIRHGETEWNRDQRVQGHLDVALSERGVEQARRLAQWLEADPPDVIYSSDLQRARQTAEIVSGGRLPVREEPRVREARFGVFEGLTSAEIEAAYPEAFHAWRRDAIRNRPPGGETLEDLGSRCMAALSEMAAAHPGQKIAVVAHGGPVRCMVCGLLELPLAVYPKLRVENTAVSRILFNAKGSILAGFNETSHLRADPVAPQHAGWEEK